MPGAPHLAERNQDPVGAGLTTIATVNDVSLALGGETLFDGLSFQVHQGDHIGQGQMARASRVCSVCSRARSNPTAERFERSLGCRFLPQEIACFQTNGSCRSSSIASDEAELRQNRTTRSTSRRAGARQQSRRGRARRRRHQSRSCTANRGTRRASPDEASGSARARIFSKRPRTSAFGLSGGWKMRRLGLALVSETWLAAARRAAQPSDMPCAWFSKFLSSYDQALILVSR
jgi:hypothetical protein